MAAAQCPFRLPGAGLPGVGNAGENLRWGLLLSKIGVRPRVFRRPRNIFYGWWIVGISAAIDALKHGSFNRGFTLYVLPLKNELGIGLAAVSLAEMLGRMEGGLHGPLIGWANDRFGPRAIMLLGGLASGSGFILLSLTQSYLYFLLVFVGLLSFGMRAGYNSATMPAINSWFRRRRSLAMAVSDMGSALGGLLLTPALGLLMFATDWRLTAMISGCVILAVVVPLSFLMHRAPESRGLLPDGDRPAPRPRVPAASATAGAPAVGFRLLPGEPDFTARQAMRTPSYWMLVTAVGLRNAVHSGTMWLLSPIIVWFLTGGGRTEDESLRISALLIGLMSLCSLAMTPVMGWLGDSFPKQRLSAVAMLGGAATAMVLLNHSGAMWQAVLFVFGLAFAETASPLAWAIMGDYFGRRAFATLRGWQHLPGQFMAMGSPVWMGYIVDRTDSYVWALIPLGIISATAALIYWIIPRPKPPGG